jgi:hypothetical protein
MKIALKNPIHITALALGLYGGMLGWGHGFFATLQWGAISDGVFINAIGPPCMPETVWHACFPALTLVPNIALSGFLAMLTGLWILVWSLGFLLHERGGIGLIFFSFIMFLVGGGFVSTFIGILAGVAGTRILNPPNWKWGGAGTLFGRLVRIWPWALGLLWVWLPGSWILGFFFRARMLALSTGLFLIFDIGLPLLIVFLSFLRQSSNENEAENP